MNLKCNAIFSFNIVLQQNNVSVEYFSSHNCFVSTNYLMLPKQKLSGMLTMFLFNLKDDTLDGGAKEVLDGGGGDRRKYSEEFSSSTITIQLDINIENIVGGEGDRRKYSDEFFFFNNNKLIDIDNIDVGEGDRRKYSEDFFFFSIKTYISNY